MKHIAFKTTLILFVLSILAVSADSFAKSKYERITNGIGNVIVGEVLPYNDDEGYKNPVIDSVKLSEMEQWETFYYRVYLGKKISSFKHDMRVITMTLKGVGGDAAKFDDEEGGTVIAWVKRKEDSKEYGERTEWSRYFEDFQSTGIPFDYYYFPFDPAKPSSFEFHTGDEIGNEINLTPEKMRSWKEKYNLKQITVTMLVFSFDDLGETVTGENKKVTVAKTDINGNVTYEEKEQLAKIKTVTKWGNKKFLAQGKFKIILD